MGVRSRLLHFYISRAYLIAHDEARLNVKDATVLPVLTRVVTTQVFFYWALPGKLPVINLLFVGYKIAGHDPGQVFFYWAVRLNRKTPNVTKA